jgi:hypothetical protein
MRDVYAKYWLKDGGDFIAQDVPLLTDLPFRPYSPAQMLQAFLDTYCGGVDLFSILASGGGDQTKVEQLIQSGCPDQYRPDLLPYLRRVQETRDSTLQLDAVPHGFLMPSCFYCEERKRRHAQTDYWFEYVGTAMHKSLLTRRS